MHEMLKRHEGFRSKMYRDSLGVWTIGYGLNLESGITEEEAAYLLDMRVRKIEEILNKSLYFWDELSPIRKEVLINMAYNLGVDGLYKFRTTLRLIGEKRYEEASNQMLNSLWARQVPNRARELSNLMKDGGAMSG